jgi:iron complex transport system ATP-binding protein
MEDLLIKDVSFTYNNGPVLSNLNLSVADGEMVGLIGPNGSGKTTLLKLISGILRPAEGRVHLDGLEPGRAKRRLVAQKVAVVPQQFHVPFAFTVEEVVMLGRTPFQKMLSNGSKEDTGAVTEAIESVGAQSLRHRYFNELSGGERQKVVLAMALAQQPGLLLLDEPTAHLDISHQIDILQLLLSLNRQRGMTIIAAMHDLNLAAMYFRRLILLHHGSVVANGTPAQVLTRDLIHQAYSASVHVERHPITEAPYIIVMPGNGSPHP